MPSTYFNIKPLSLSQDEVGDFFYDREGDELDFLLNQITKSKGGKAFAISGRRGSGKSTLIHKLIKSLEKDKENYLIVKVDVPKEFDELFLLKRILRKVCETAIIDGRINKDDIMLGEVLAKLIHLDYQTARINEIGEEETVIKAIRGGVKAIVEIGGDRSTVHNEIDKTINEMRFLEYDLERVQSDLEKLLNKLKEVFKGIVIIVDETDKSNYVEAVKTLDNIKPLFWLENCYYIFVGSQEFYEDYLGGIKTGRKTLLDSLFTKIIYLRPFTKDDLIGMLEKRFSKEVSEETSEILDIIATISKGTPRDAMRYCDLLVGECGSIEDATLADLRKVIYDTFPRFPPGNLKYFIPLSSHISEIAHRIIIEPATESCAVSIIACILEMKPHSESETDHQIFNCEKGIVTEALIGDSGEKYGYSKTEFETALTFLEELGLVSEKNENLTLIILNDILSEYKRVLEVI